MISLNKTVQVKGLDIGVDRPKICVPLVGKTIDELVITSEKITTYDMDLVEWRVDFFQEVEQLDQVKKALVKLRSVISKVPILFTFRTAKEGGEKAISDEYYLELNKEIMQTGQIDLVDIELYTPAPIRDQLLKKAQLYDVKTIVSNHEFDKTPPKEEIIARLQQAEVLGADISKIAVMPNKPHDVLTLLSATEEMHRIHTNIPIITMAMGGMGLISRLSGELFGSCLTFAAVDQTSAPGQVSVNELLPILNIINKNIGN